MLYEQALAMAFASFPKANGPIVPFTLVTTNDKMIHTTIITSNSHKAMTIGRRMVLESKGDQYAIVTDTFVRVDGQRYDAIFVEYGGLDIGRVIAQRYRRTPAPEKVGAPLDVERRPSALLPLDPFALDWGAITPDMFDEAQNLAVHSVSHDLQSPERIARTARFLRARARVFRNSLPPEAKQLAVVDDRGQKVDRAALEKSLGSELPVKFVGDR